MSHVPSTHIMLYALFTLYAYGFIVAVQNRVDPDQLKPADLNYTVFSRGYIFF